MRNRPATDKAWLVILSAVLSSVPAASRAAPADCPPPRAAASASLAKLSEVMASGRFIGYEPTSHRVVDGVSSAADPASITADLKVLRPYFDGLITYGAHSGMDRVADVAATLGFRAVILGIWDIGDEAEVAAALAAARRRPDIIAGISVGNEILYGRRADAATISDAMVKVRDSAPSLVIATTEPFHVWLQPDAAPLRAASDVVLANVHPVFEGWWRAAPDANAAAFVVDVAAQVAAVSCAPVLVKETGVPTAPADLGFTPERQAAFYAELRKALPPTAVRAFAYFSAFDAPWREFDAHPTPGPQPQEAHWGLFDARRAPKPVMSVIAPLAGPTMPAR